MRYQAHPIETGQEIGYRSWQKTPFHVWMREGREASPLAKKN